MHRIFTLCLQLILIDNTLAQFGPTLQPTLQPTQSAPINQQLSNTPIPTQQPIKSPIPKQQLINYLLQNSNQASLPEKIEVLTAAVQNIPPRRTNYQADLFQQSALQSLKAASTFCDTNINQVLNNLIPNTGLQHVEYTNQAFTNMIPNSGLSLLPKRSVLSLIEYVPQLRQPISQKVVVANEPLLVANDLSVLSNSIVSGLDYLPKRIGRFLI